jgi:predicted transcriptional regulator
MPTLTVTEKAFWKDRIAARIDRARDRIRAQHPSLFERVRREAHEQALASLGLADAYV